MNKGFKTKSNKGITLVALIITIVVLLILAGVAIGTVRDSDIIGYAKNAAGGYNEAKQNEIDQIAGYEELLKNYGNSNSGNFDWSSVNLGGVDLNAYYETEQDVIYRLTFKANGTIEVTRDGVLETIDITKAEKTSNGIKFNYTAMNTDVILSMDGNNIKAELPNLNGGMTITYERYKMMEVYAEAEENAKLACFIITENGIWLCSITDETARNGFDEAELYKGEGSIEELTEELGRGAFTIEGMNLVEDGTYKWVIENKTEGKRLGYLIDKNAEEEYMAYIRDTGTSELKVESKLYKYSIAVPDSILSQIEN